MRTNRENPISSNWLVNCPESGTNILFPSLACALFIFALTPLPDDLIFIPLGVMHYNPIKAILPALAGKFLMNLIIAYGGRYSIEFIEDIFGVGNELIVSLLIFATGIILTIVLFRVDWGKYFGKYLS